MTEHTFIRALHKLLPSISGSFFRWKINDQFAGGCADALYAGPRGLLFIEYKYVKQYPKRETTKVPFKVDPLQIAWLERMHGFGQRVAVIVGCGKDCVILEDPKDWGRKITMAEFKRRAITRKETAEWIQLVTNGRVSPKQNGG